MVVNKMKKSLKAISRGYIFFKVNNKKFYFYDSAQNFCNKQKKKKQNLTFEGFNFFWFLKDLFFPSHHLKVFGFKKGWRGFFSRQYFN